MHLLAVPYAPNRAEGSSLHLYYVMRLSRLGGPVLCFNNRSMLCNLHFDN